MLDEGTIEDFDGFDVPSAPAPEGLDLNRNYPAGWGTSVPGAGDHPLSEPEIDALVRAIVARPNICGFNAFHTSGGVILRPSSTKPDSKLPPGDVWTWKQLAAIGTELTGYPSHSVYEDFTWDPTETMSGASDDWAYEHLGIFGWTTEFWDIVHAATGEKQSTHFWYTGPTDAERLAVLRWLDEHSTDERHARFRRLVPVRPPAARPGGTRRLERLVLVDQPAAGPAPRRGRSVTPTSPSPKHSPRRASRSATPALEPVGDGHLARRHRRGQHRMAADHREFEGPPGRSGAADRSPTSSAAVEVLDGAARRTLGQLAGSSSARFTNSTEARPIGRAARGSSGHRPGTTVDRAVQHQHGPAIRLAWSSTLAMTAMTTDAWITLVVLIATFGVLAFDRLPTAAAMGAAVGVLLLTDVVDQSEALSGLSSSAPITIAALYVLAGAATVTGALSPLIDRVLDGSPKRGASTGPISGSRGRLGRLAVASGALSAVLPNTPLVALAAPRVVTWCRRSGVSASPYLIPLSYAAVFGGVVTVIGTSTNLVVSDLLVAQGGDPLGVFEITGVGLPDRGGRHRGAGAHGASPAP